MGKRSIVEINVEDVEKRRIPGKHYVYVISVSWSDGVKTKIFRRYSVFFDFQYKLLDRFPEEAGASDPSDRIIPFLPGKKYIGRSHVRKVALERLEPINEYCKALIRLPEEISQSKDVIDFFSIDNDDLNPPSAEKNEKWKANKISGPKLNERYVAIADYNAEKPGEVSLTNGVMIVDVIEKSESGWWFVTTEDSQGWAPSTYLVREDGAVDAPLFVAKCGEEESYIVTENYMAAGDDELSVLKGEVVKIIEKHTNGWWLVRHDSKTGWVPATFLKPKPITCDRNSLVMAATNVEVVGNLADISDLLKTGKTDVITHKVHKQKHPPRAGSLPRNVPSMPSPPPLQYFTVAEFCDKVGDGLSFHSGEAVNVIEKTSSGWWFVEIAGEEGWVPASYICSQSSPNTSPSKHEVSSFEDEDSFSSLDSSPFHIAHAPQVKTETEYTSTPMTFNEAVAAKAKTDCIENVHPRKESTTRQIGRDGRRSSSGSIPTTPTNESTECALWTRTNVSNGDVRPVRVSTPSVSNSRLPTDPKNSIDEIKKMINLSNGDLPVKLKPVERSVVGTDRSAKPSTQQGPLLPGLPKPAVPLLPQKNLTVRTNSIDKQLPLVLPKPPPKSGNTSNCFSEDMKYKIEKSNDAKPPPPMVPPGKLSLTSKLQMSDTSGYKNDTPALPTKPLNIHRKPSVPCKVQVNQKSTVPGNGNKANMESESISRVKSQIANNTANSPTPSLAPKPSTAKKPQIPLKQKSDLSKPTDKVNQRERLIVETHKDLQTVNKELNNRFSSGSVSSTDSENTFVVIADVVGMNEGEISLHQGSEVVVQQQDPSGWWFVTHCGEEGWAPMTYLEQRLSSRRSSNTPKPVKPPKPSLKLA